MQGIKATTESREPKDLNNSSTATSDQRNDNQFVSTGILSTWELPTHLQCLAPTNFTRKLALQRLAVVVLRIRSTTKITIPLSVCTRKHDKCFTDGISTSRRSEQVQPRQAAAHDCGRQREGGGGGRVVKGGEGAANLGFLE
ncbi:hypothetical protein F511_32949 [Dorcoceras hygrometricum]|uniref:Uncharacterized protein n=1 Tax=Dorcoceras hygrometricum TaxID=472368 RepID=A0A2Z7BJE6_9LAMI|nr:hypothetical protein F511_32949 [Dorcoceras hygrometricum]